MPAVLSYPGVYIEEVQSSVRTISGVGTSIAAFVGRTLRGPVDAAVTINSYADFERRFGGLWLGSPLSYAVRDFYLNGGGQAVIVRLFHPSFADEAARQAAITTATAAAQAGADAVDDAAAAAVAGAADAKAVADAAKTAADAVADPVGKHAANVVAAKAAAAAKATPADKQGAATAAHAAVADAVATAAADETPRTRAHIDAGGLSLEAAGPGSWGNKLEVTIDHDVVPADPKAFNLKVRDLSTNTTEVFRNVSIDPLAGRRIDHVLESASTLLIFADTALPANIPTAGVSTVAAAGAAADGKVLTGADDFTPNGAEAGKTGLYALDHAEQFNLLCIPPHALEGDIENTLINAAIAYCTRRRAIMLVDPKAGWVKKEDPLAGVDQGDVGDPSANAALYFPRLIQANPLREGREEAFAPCGAIAGLIARTDNQRGVWKAPAGLDATLVNTPRLSVSLTDLENGELNPKGINCLRALPGAGRVVWGSRTRRGDDRLADQWKYLPVRRTALFIEESLYRGTQWVVFEPNDEPLWSSIRLNVGAFMNGLFRQGAFQGSSPRDAYFVKCDKDTTTQADIDRGIVNIAVGFAPLKPAEFVVIRLEQMAGQVQA